MHVNDYKVSAGPPTLGGDLQLMEIEKTDDFSFLYVRQDELEQKNVLISQEMQTLSFNGEKKRLSAKLSNQTMHCIVEDIYLGDLHAYREWIKQAQENPSHSYSLISVVDIDSEIEIPNNIEHLKFHILDDGSAWSTENGIESKLKAVFQFINRARIEKKSLLIHCLTGRSRSVTFLAAYLMWSCRQRYEVVLPFLQSKRWQAAPCNDLKSFLSDDFQQILISKGILS